MHVSASVVSLALRLWWPIIAALAIIGTAGGYLSVQNAPYAATTSLRVDTAGFGEIAQRSIVETSRLLVDSNRTYRKVVGDSAEAIEEIRQRTTVEIVATSSVLRITVAADRAEQAQTEVNAIAEASMDNVRELAGEQFDATIGAGARALATGVLTDPAAELARKNAVGTAIAGQQDNALRLSASLSRIGAVLPAVRVGLAPRTAMALGALAGLAAGCVIALLLGVGRRRIRGRNDMRIAAELVACDPQDRAEGVAKAAAGCSRVPHPLAVVLALPGAEPAVRGVSDELRAELRRDGSRPFPLDDDDLALPPGAAWIGATERPTPHPRPHQNGSAPTATQVPALGMPKRAADLADADADLLLVTGVAHQRTVNQIAGRADIVLLVAQRRRTRLRQIAAACASLGLPRPPIVILVDPESDASTADPCAVADAAPQLSPAATHGTDG